MFYQLNFTQDFIRGTYSSDWIKGNVVSLNNKDNKHNIKNYRPVSLLPICGKIFENSLFNKINKK